MSKAAAMGLSFAHLAVLMPLRAVGLALSKARPPYVVLFRNGKKKRRIVGVRRADFRKIIIDWFVAPSAVMSRQGATCLRRDGKIVWQTEYAGDDPNVERKISIIALESASLWNK